MKREHTSSVKELVFKQFQGNPTKPQKEGKRLEEHFWKNDSHSPCFKNKQGIVKMDGLRPI